MGDGGKSQRGKAVAGEKILVLISEFLLLLSFKITLYERKIRRTIASRD
jgi:hypothetical protein